MVLVGKINKDIVGLINDIGGHAVGLSGKDGNLLVADKKMGRMRGPNGTDELVDIGLVGEVRQVNPGIVDTLIREGYIPVVAPVAVGEGGDSYNVNADSAAAALAVALNADKLIILTDVEGILADRNDKASLISTVSRQEVPHLVEQGIVDGGMIPKVECCLSALRGGVGTTHILDGRVPHSVLLEIFTDQGVGTMVIN
jgi:acetylglutamate kinase